MDYNNRSRVEYSSANYPDPSNRENKRIVRTFEKIPTHESRGRISYQAFVSTILPKLAPALEEIQNKEFEERYKKQIWIAYTKGYDISNSPSKKNIANLYVNSYLYCLEKELRLENKFFEAQAVKRCIATGCMVEKKALLKSVHTDYRNCRYSSFLHDGYLENERIRNSDDKNIRAKNITNKRHFIHMLFKGDYEEVRKSLTRQLTKAVNSKNFNIDNFLNMEHIINEHIKGDISSPLPDRTIRRIGERGDIVGQKVDSYFNPDFDFKKVIEEQILKKPENIDKLVDFLLCGEEGQSVIFNIKTDKNTGIGINYDFSISPTSSLAVVITTSNDEKDLNQGKILSSMPGFKVLTTYPVSDENDKSNEEQNTEYISASDIAKHTQERFLRTPLFRTAQLLKSEIKDKRIGISYHNRFVKTDESCVFIRFNTKNKNCKIKINAKGEFSFDVNDQVIPSKKLYQTFKDEPAINEFIQSVIELSATQQSLGNVVSLDELAKQNKKKSLDDLINNPEETQENITHYTFHNPFKNEYKDPRTFEDVKIDAIGG